jgi:hypothetical protein
VVHAARQLDRLGGGGYGEQSGGIFIHTRQQAPDTTRPKVAFHIPVDGRTNYSPHMPVSVIIHEELDSETLHSGTNFSLRKVVDNAPSGEPVDCFAHLGSNNVLMITPKAPLDEDSTYQMTFQEANGLRAISVTPTATAFPMPSKNFMGFLIKS